MYDLFDCRRYVMCTNVRGRARVVYESAFAFLLRITGIKEFLSFNWCCTAVDGPIRIHNITIIESMSDIKKFSIN